MVHPVKDPVLSLLQFWVTAMAQVPFPAQELLHTMGMAKEKKKKKKEEEEDSRQKIQSQTLEGE